MTYIRYERRGDQVVPVRVEKRWVTYKGEPGRWWTTVRLTELAWCHLERAELPPDVPGAIRVEPPSRWALSQRGFIREPGDGAPCLGLDDRAMDSAELEIGRVVLDAMEVVDAAA